MKDTNESDNVDEIDTRWFDRDKMTREYLEVSKLLDECMVPSVNEYGIPYRLAVRISKLIDMRTLKQQ